MESETGLMQRNEESDIRTMVAAVRNRLAAVRELMKSELKGPTQDHPEGRDYGFVPGTKKPSLLLPGAEKIALMFQFVPSFEITHEDLPGGHREYHATCTLTHGPSGRVVGQCAGSASTMETKHRYRGASGKTCPACGAMSCKASKKEWGGGYYCDAKAGGCGERFKPGAEECKALDELPTTKQENLDPADQFNTVNKIAQKRAYVGAVKGASAASEVFTVDMEDAEKSEGDEPPRPPVKMPVETKAEPAQGNTHTVTGAIDAVSVKESPADSKKPWKKYGVKIGDTWYATFDDKVGAVAIKGASVTIVYMTNAKGYHDIVALQPAGAATDAPEERGDAHEGEPSTLDKIEAFWNERGLPIGKLLSLLRHDKLLGEFDDLGKLAENKQPEVLGKIGVYASRCK